MIWNVKYIAFTDEMTQTDVIDEALTEYVASGRKRMGLYRRRGKFPYKSNIMTITDYISGQQPDRQKVIAEIHEIILAKDKTVQAGIEPMMGKEMIIYKASGMFKYGLSSVKDYMSLHVLPIYGAPALHAKYKQLLSLATFQKGCINFRNSESVPSAILQDLFEECSRIDLFAIRQNQLQSKAKNRKTSLK